MEAQDWPSFHVYDARPRSSILHGERRGSCPVISLTSFHQSHKDNFFDVFYESLVAPELTIEHEYVSLLSSVDGLHHPLLVGLTLQKRLDGDYLVTETDFEPFRRVVITRAYHELSGRKLTLMQLPKRGR